MNETYNKETIDVKFNSVHDRFDVQDKALDKILEQTTKTNGSVLKLQKDMEGTASKEEVEKIKRNLLIVACITGTVLILKFPEVIEVIKTFI